MELRHSGISVHIERDLPSTRVRETAVDWCPSRSSPRCRLANTSGLRGP